MVALPDRAILTLAGWKEKGGPPHLRVLIELFDRNPICNVLAACIFGPEVVVYLCDERDSGFFKESAIYRLFRRRKMRTQPRFYYFDATDPIGIRRVLGAVVRDYPGCVFDFTGGHDLVLLVAGSCFSEWEVPGFYIDIERARFINLRGCDNIRQRFQFPTFSADDIFTMSGATIQGHGHFPLDAVDADFEEDVLATFAIVQKNPKAWGEFVSWLQAFCAGTPSSALAVSGPRRAKTARTQVRANPVLLQHLLQAGILSRLLLAKNQVELTFKSPLHRRCLLIEGIWLELYCYVVSKRSGVFSDVRTSIVVDWDGVEGGSDNAKNEVDVFLVRGVTPVFISCKMSIPSALALSEIRLLASKFGGGYAKAVVLTAGRFGEEHKALKARAADLGILLLDRATTEQELLVDELTRVSDLQPPAGGPRLANADMLPNAVPE